jgi:hypothetical protein
MQHCYLPSKADQWCCHGLSRQPQYPYYFSTISLNAVRLETMRFIVVLSIVLEAVRLSITVSITSPKVGTPVLVSVITSAIDKDSEADI